MFRKCTIPPFATVHAVELVANRLLCGKRFEKSRPASPDNAITCRMCLLYLSRLIPSQRLPMTQREDISDQAKPAQILPDVAICRAKPSGGN
jgi:hypothetical protein